jgi:hypothetical protein
MDVCLRSFCVSVVLCVGSGLAKRWSPVQGSYGLCIGSRNRKSGQSWTKGCTAIDEQMNELNMYIAIGCRSQWPRGLRHELSSLARTLGSRVRIPLEAWMSVFILFVLGSGLAMGWSLVQGVLLTV